MTFPKARLAVAACLFFGWIGFLLYLVITSHSVVVSKPQFLVAQLYVVVDLRGARGDLHPDGEVTIDKVLWAARDADRKLEGEVIRLAEMAAFTKATGYRGAGKYVVPLIHSPDGLQIAPMPRLNSYPRKPATHGTVEAFGVFSQRRARQLAIVEAMRLRDEWEKAGFDVVLWEEELRIYPWTSDTRAQVDELIAAKSR